VDLKAVAVAPEADAEVADRVAAEMVSAAAAGQGLASFEQAKRPERTNARAGRKKEAAVAERQGWVAR